MRAYNGKIFRLDRHLARLQKSAKTLKLGSKLAMFNLAQACYEVIEANKLTQARIRLTLSAGEGDITPNSDTCQNVTVFIAARNITHTSTENYHVGFKAVLSSYRRNSQSQLSTMKSTAYLDNFLAKQEARAAKADEAIMLNERRYVAEGSSSNIFLVKGKALITPRIESGVLPGITREAVLELAQSSGMDTIEREMKLTELVEADEAFLTNSIIEIVPLIRLDNKPIGTGQKGPVTQEITSAYKKLVERETESS